MHVLNITAIAISGSMIGGWLRYWQLNTQAQTEEVDTPNNTLTMIKH
ncbi:MAG: hypothetical protein AAF171_11090 [Cyanobacteria bacterium P01_A01_bin.116]